MILCVVLLCNILLPDMEISNSERRYLDVFPALDLSSVWDGSFFTDFETYTTDQFAGRDSMRTLKVWTQLYLLRQRDVGGIYIGAGHVFQSDPALNEASISGFVDKIHTLQQTLLTDSRIFVSVIPSKSAYYAAQHGYPELDHAVLEERVRAALAPDITCIPLQAYLTLDDYYTTDLHWRQERLAPVITQLNAALGIDAPLPTDHLYTPQQYAPFYGAYYGQAALPIPADTLTFLDSAVLQQCTVEHIDPALGSTVYDLSRLQGLDAYDVFLSGPSAVTVIQNPQCTSGRELIIFRDSFASSLAPLLAEEYQRITLIDLRYIASSQLSEYVDFHGQDVLFLYASLVVNNSTMLK